LSFLLGLPEEFNPIINAPLVMLFDQPQGLINLPFFRIVGVLCEDLACVPHQYLLGFLILLVRSVLPQGRAVHLRVRVHAAVPRVLRERQGGPADVALDYVLACATLCVLALHRPLEGQPPDHYGQPFLLHRQVCAAPLHVLIRVHLSTLLVQADAEGALTIVRYLFLRAKLKNLLQMGIVDAGRDRTLVDIVPDASRAENFPGDPRGGGELLISPDFRISESYHRVVVLVRFLFEARVVVTGPPQVLIFLPEAEFIAHILLKYLWLRCPNECTIGGPRIIGHGTVDCMVPVMCGVP
jgi:hypothetical protein